MMLLAIVGVATALSPLFLTTLNISNVLRQAAALGVVSVGQTFVILTAGIDLSVGSVITLTDCIAAGVMQGRPERMIPAALLALAVGLVIGLINGLTITKLRLPDFIVTLGMMSIANGLVFIYTDGREVGLVTRRFTSLSEGSIGPIPMAFVVWAIVAILGIILLGFARKGRHIYAAGGNPEVARLSGINVDVIRTLAYMFCGLTAAMSGLILAARLRVGYPIAGRGFELDSIAAVVIGGTSLFGGRGGVGGTIAGVLIMSILNNILNLLVIPGFVQMVIKGLIIIGVVAVRTRSLK